MIVQRSQESRSPAMYISFRKVTPGEAKMGLNDTTSISIACFVPQAKILFWPLTIVRSIRWQKYWPRSIFCEITLLDFTLLHIKKNEKIPPSPNKLGFIFREPELARQMGRNGATEAEFCPNLVACNAGVFYSASY